MALIRCPAEKHFYDPEKFEVCPYCVSVLGEPMATIPCPEGKHFYDPGKFKVCPYCVSIFQLVDEFRFSHEPHLGAKNDMDLFGRERLIASLGNRIAQSRGGSFLLCGYRGVGKTSLVNAIVRHVEKLSRAQDSIGDLIEVRLALTRPVPVANIMYQIVTGIWRELGRKKQLHRLRPDIRRELVLAVNRTALNLTRKEQNDTATTLGASLNSYLGSFKAEFGRKHTRNSTLEEVFLPYDQCAVEQDIMAILSAFGNEGSLRRNVMKGGIPQIFGYYRQYRRIRTLIVFDEIDKFEDTTEKPGLDAFKEILREIKTLLTTAGATFVFVGGRGLYDDWLTDSRRGDSIYESVFSQVEYIPTIDNLSRLLCESVIQADEYSEKVEDKIENFKNYLSFQGRGIPRLTLKAFYRFVDATDGKLELHFSNKDLRGFKGYSDLERCIMQAIGEILEFRGGSTDLHVRDRDSLLLHYMVDWIFSRNTEAFRLEELVNECANFPRITSSADRSIQNLTEILVRCLADHNFLENTLFPVGSENKGWTQNWKKGQSMWYCSRKRLIELGRELRVYGADGAPMTVVGGRYALEQKIGSGGFSEVYRAKDLINRSQVALKKSAKISSGKARKIMDHEARVMREFTTKDAPELIDYNELHDPPYLVMELLDGFSLSKIIDPNSLLGWESISYLGSAIANAIANLHQSGILWGDIKPANVIVNEASVRIMDFGAACLCRDDESVVEHAVGTPPYMAPECLRGGKISVKSEVYAFGVLLHELCTGHRPFRGTKIAAVLGEIDNSSLEPRQYREDFSPVFEEIIKKCLSVDTDLRYENMQDILNLIPTVENAPEICEILAHLRQGASSTGFNYPEVSTAGVTPGLTITAGVTPGLTIRCQSGKHFFDNRKFPVCPYCGVEDLEEFSATGGIPPLLTCAISTPRWSREQKIFKKRVRIGRDWDNDIEINDASVSRYQLEIFEEHGIWRVQDANSLNGTFLDGQLVSRASLSVGSAITFGECQIDVISIYPDAVSE